MYGSALYWGYTIGIMENKMATTIMHPEYAFQRVSMLCGTLEAAFRSCPLVHGSPCSTHLCILICVHIYI